MLSATFDHPNLVSAGGLVPVVALAQDCRLGESVADKPRLNASGGLPESWAADVTAALRLIEILNGETNDCEPALRRLGVHHAYEPLLMSAPGIGWVLGYTFAAKIGDITRSATPKKLVGYTGHPRCPSPRLRRPLSAGQDPAGPPARRLGRPRRHRPQAHRGNLANAHRPQALRSGRRHTAPSGRVDGPSLRCASGAKPPIRHSYSCQEALER